MTVFNDQAEACWLTFCVLQAVQALLGRPTGVHILQICSICSGKAGWRALQSGFYSVEGLRQNLAMYKAEFRVLEERKTMIWEYLLMSHATRRPSPLHL